MIDMKHMDYLHVVAREDVAVLTEKERNYAGSWKRRGGVGVFMMLARKWDRLESILGQRNGAKSRGVGSGHARLAETAQWNVFSWIDTEQDEQGADGTVLAEVRDLRRYLLLVEAEMMARGVVPAPEAREWVAGAAAKKDSAAKSWESTDRFRWWSPPDLREPAPVPLTDSNRPAERAVPPTPTALPPTPPRAEVNHYELALLPPEERALYQWSAERSCYVLGA